MPTTTTRLGFTRPIGGDPFTVRSHITTLSDQLDTLVAADYQGTLAARMVPGKRGRYYWATDTLQLFRDDGVAWIELNPVWVRAGAAAARPLASSLRVGSVYFSTDDSGGRPSIVVSGAWVNMGAPNTITNTQIADGTLAPEKITGIAMTSGVPTWTILTLENSYVASTFHPAPRVAKVGRMVFVEGYVGHASGASPASIVMTTLPVGFRPGRQHVVDLYNELNTGQIHGKTLFNADGTVVADSGGGWNRSIFYSFLAA